MKAVSPEIRTHRILGWCCVLHSLLALLLLFSFLFLSLDYGDSKIGAILYSAWIIFSTLWFVWPVILLVHPARSWRRVLVPIGVGYLFYMLWGRMQSRGLNDLGINLGITLGEDSGFVDLTPHDLAWYAIAYGRGWVDGKHDAKAGRLILEAYGFGTMTPSTPTLCNLPKEDLEKCGLEFNHVTGCVVNTWILGHARSYNKVMMAKIREHCPALVKAAEDEEARDHQASEEGEKIGRAEAEADSRARRLAIVLDDPDRKDDKAFENWLREKYGLGVKRVNPRASPNFDTKLGAYASAYNRIAGEEIRRRFGKRAEQEIWDQWVKIPQTESGPPIPH